MELRSTAHEIYGYIQRWGLCGSGTRDEPRVQGHHTTHKHEEKQCWTDIPTFMGNVKDSIIDLRYDGEHTSLLSLPRGNGGIDMAVAFTRPIICTSVQRLWRANQRHVNGDTSSLLPLVFQSSAGRLSDERSICLECEV